VTDIRAVSGSGKGVGGDGRAMTKRERKSRKMKWNECGYI